MHVRAQVDIETQSRFINNFIKWWVGVCCVHDYTPVGISARVCKVCQRGVKINLKNSFRFKTDQQISLSPKYKRSVTHALATYRTMHHSKCSLPAPSLQPG